MAKSTDEAKSSGMFTAEGTENDLRWGELLVDGVTYRLRQITVDEGDSSYDAAYNEQTSKFNSRLNSRLNLAASIVSPPTSIDDMRRWSGVKLVTLLRAWDALNILPDADLKGNA